MSRSLRSAPLLVAITILAGCHDSRPDVTSPNNPPGARDVQPAQTGDLDTRILALADSIFPKGLSTAFDTRWADLKRQLSRGAKGPAADTRQMYVNLVSWVQTQAGSLNPPTGETASHVSVRLALYVSVYVFQGPTAQPPVLSGATDAAFGIVQPTAPDTIQVPSLHAGVAFPAGAVSEPTVVVVFKETTLYPQNCSGPLVTRLCQYPQFYHFDVFPDVKLQLPATVAVCHTNSGNARRPLADHDRFRLAHDAPSDPTAHIPGGTLVDGIEILPLVLAPALINCATSDSYGTAMQRRTRDGAFGRLLDRVLDGGLELVAGIGAGLGKLLSPRDAYAIDQGGGGFVLEFSTFADVDPLSQPDASIQSAFGLLSPTAGEGGSVTINPFTVQNVGTASISGYSTTIVLANDAALTLSRVTLGAPVHHGVLAAAGTETVPQQTVKIPTGLSLGGHYVGVQMTLDAGSLPELDASNNSASAPLGVVVAMGNSPLAVTDVNACLIKTAATYCWGSNSIGTLGDGTTLTRRIPVATAGGFQFISIVGGWEDTCGLTAAGIVACWGANFFGEVGDGSLVRNRSTPSAVAGGVLFNAVAAGTAHFCALTAAGAAYCWGANDAGGLGDGTTTNRSAPTPVGGALQFTSLGLGMLHSCGLTAAGAAYCWGWNDNGELGDGSTLQRTTPVPVSGGRIFVAITGGNAHTCGLTASGDAYCWGLNDSGEIGDGTTTSRPTPTLVAGGHKFTAIQGAHNGNGEGSTCALDGSGTLYCWGSNIRGQLGDGSATNRLVPTPVAGGYKFTHFDLDNEGGCGLVAGATPYCWGENTFSDITAQVRLLPTAVAGGLSFTDVSAGNGATCGVRVGGAGFCWGTNISRALGDGSMAPHNSPTPVSGGITFTTVATNGFQTCALAVGGAAYCWGSIGLSVGIGTGGSATPAPVAGGLAFATIGVVSLTGSGARACGLTTAGAAYCWGVSSATPVAIAGGGTYSSIAVSGGGACTLTGSGSAFCWGPNTHGELGAGFSSSSSTIPLPVVGGLTFTSLAAGANHACGVASGGGAYCWGSNANGQLGTGVAATTPNPAPLPVAGGLTFMQLAAGSTHTCGLTVSGALYCWGSNVSGPLGDGTETDHLTPQPVASGLSFTRVTAGASHTCAWTSAGATYCWGLNVQGQVGDGTSTYSLVPVPVSVP